MADFQPRLAAEPAPESALAQRWLLRALQAFFLLAGVLQGFAQWQHYHALGGAHPWEPFLWELSSTVVTASVVPWLYRWHVATLDKSWLAIVARHAAGWAVYATIHIGGMFGLRLAVYALVGVPYDPGRVGDILAYELGKDAITYLALLGLCHCIWLYLQHQAASLQLQVLRTALAEERLARLMEQLQPHFLFNTLNLIAATMHEDVDRADQLLCDLSALLRQSLQAQTNMQHTLAAELELVRPFLAIMQARFGQRLTVQLDVADAAMHGLVPALVLLTPLENAVKHDVAQHSLAVVLRVCARRDGDQLLMAVESTGISPQSDQRDGSLGLPALRQRLALHYEGRARLQLDRLGADGGGRLQMVLPWVAQREPAP